MDEVNLEGLASTIAKHLYGTHECLCVTLIRQLSLGQPVAPAQLATDLAIDQLAVMTVLAKIPDVDYDTAGNVVGFGLSLSPTPHQCMINGQSLYTWCALDTFLYTALLDRQVGVLSHCPVTDHPIALTMTPERILELAPASSVISVVIPKASVSNCRRSGFCNHGHFFATAEAGALWQHDHPNGVILPVGAAHRLGRLLADARLLLAGQ